jgi:hypothetical protein
MATSLLTPTAAAAPRTSTAATTDIPWQMAATVVAATSILIGIIWDISWHRTIGRDTFWTPAHMAVYFGGTLAGLSCGARVLYDSFGPGRATAHDRGVTIWRWFTGPIGGWMCIWGALAMLTSAPFDDWWHGAYGLDVEILSPPHVVLLVGIAGILIGAQTMAAAAQNRDGASTTLANVFLFASAVLLSMAAIAVTDYTFPERLHTSTFYIVTGGVFPAILVASARASRLRWPATVTALFYMLIMAAQVWILPLFPGSPKLGPIGHDVTQMVPLPFPLLLVGPGLAIDIILRRMNGRHPWLISLAIGVGYIAALAIVQWPFGSLQATELGRSAFFGGSHGDYGALPEWLTGPREMWTEDGGLPRTLLRMATWGVLVATISARLGYARGGFMRRVVR